jgi:hypothetical protein
MDRTEPLCEEARVYQYGIATTDPATKRDSGDAPKTGLLASSEHETMCRTRQLNNE